MIKIVVDKKEQINARHKQTAHPQWRTDKITLPQESSTVYVAKSI